MSLKLSSCHSHASHASGILQTMPDMEGIGETPLHSLHFPEGIVYAKAEFRNEGGFSSKCRLVKEITQPALLRGELGTHKILLEVTSGNTGISNLKFCINRGIRVILLVGDSASLRRKQYLRELGAEVRTFDDSVLGYDAGLAIKDQMMAAEPGVYWTPDQFSNAGNWEGHQQTTAPEIATKLASHGLVADAFVMSFGTGGTLVGCGYGLRAVNPLTKLVPVRALNCPAGLPGVEGIARKGFTPKFMEVHKEALGFEEEMAITDCDAFAMCRILKHRFNLEVGPSSGLNVAAAVRYLAQNPGAVVVTMLCDRADLYKEVMDLHVHP